MLSVNRCHAQANGIGRRGKEGGNALDVHKAAECQKQISHSLSVPFRESGRCGD